MVVSSSSRLVGSLPWQVSPYIRMLEGVLVDVWARSVTAVLLGLPAGVRCDVPKMKSRNLALGNGMVKRGGGQSVVY